MKKILITAMSVFALFVPIQQAQADIRLCPTGQLQVDFMDANATATARSHKAIVHGTLEMPTPGYTFALIFEPNLYEGTMHGVMTLKDKSPDVMKTQVITPLEINQTFDIPVGTTAIFIEIIKNFNWGPEYFKGNMRKFDSICLVPDVFKQ